MPLPTKKFGDDFVSAIGYGAMGIAAYYGTIPPDEERFRVLDTCYENGCTFWDTADVYYGSEELIGAWFKHTGKRKEIFLGTKFGLASGLPDRTVLAEPQYVGLALRDSLERLETDYVDIYYLHRPDPTVPIELTVRAMAEQVKCGKVKYLGMSECSEDTLRRAHAVHPITALQVEYSPWTLDIENEQAGLLKAARELGIMLVAYAPLGRGLLTGKFSSYDQFEADDMRRIVPRYSANNFPNILKIVNVLRTVGQRHNVTAAQVALAWVMAQGDDIIPIPGTSNVQRLLENISAINLKLGEDEIQEIRRMAHNADATHGDRYPPGLAAVLFADTPPLVE